MLAIIDNDRVIHLCSTPEQAFEAFERTPRTGYIVNGSIICQPNATFFKATTGRLTIIPPLAPSI